MILSMELSNFKAILPGKLLPPLNNFFEKNNVIFAAIILTKDLILI
jgi:hypothetical protein